MGNSKTKEKEKMYDEVDDVQDEKGVKRHSKPSFMDSQVALAPAQPELYTLIDKKGGGVMVELAKQTLFKKKPKEFEEFVLKTMPSYLINDGKEEMIPVAELIQYRKMTRKNKPESDESLAKLLQKLENITREVCFDIDKRGVHGETLLHLCFSNGSYIHLQIARFLLKMYPKLVNDIYLSDEFYGQSVLHMAIVNEDPVMCKLLLTYGANVHQRAVGRFFIPDDQKNKIDWNNSEYPRLPTKTDYRAMSYYGEYPLSFAAILGQEECIRLLLAYGADINKQDSNGNTALHMAIIHDNFESAKTLIEMGADLDILNNQDLSALTLAAKLAREEVFSYIMEQTRKNYWTYADITCAAYPLKFLDPVREDGSINTNSALYIILNTEKHEYLELLKGVLHYLITEKWDAYVKYRFYSDFLIYCLYYLINGVYVYLKRSYYDFLINQSCTDSEGRNNLLTKCECSYLYPPSEDKERYARTVLEMIIFVFTVGLIAQIFRDIYVQRPRVYLESLLINPFKIIFFLALVGNIVMIPLRLSCNTYGEDLVQAMVIVFLGTYILYFGRGFRKICIYVYNIHLILRHNMLRFIIVYIILALGLSQAFLTIFMFLGPYYPNVFNTWFTSIVSTVTLSLAEVEAEYDKVRFHTSYTVLGIIYTNAFLFAGNVLMIVTLIASMDYTQEETAERELEWLRQWGLQVLSFELRVARKDRVKQKRRYTHTLANGGQALLVRWKLKGHELEEMKESKIEFMKNMDKIPPCTTFEDPSFVNPKEQSK